ncbi:HLA class II histocompatibility antigen, DR alpha chain-like, partial [Oreochromis aureus]|uniref:HLA class II histocompatibility antigen, DR alpha chain-like n=1 Tax=Oreochromis aureus TaxID=47969 RepID=UPI001953F056
QKVTEGTSTSILFPNKDGSFKQTSRLDLIPKKRDVYSCTVEHVGLTQPMSKFDAPPLNAGERQFAPPTSPLHRDCTTIIL